MANTKAPKKKIKRPKRPSLPSLITKADRITSIYIRRKFADHNGMVKCITCENVLHWKDMHCAHFIGRAKKSVRWEESNLAPACASCNVFHKESHQQNYTLYILDMYGRDKIVELKDLATQVLSPASVRLLAEDAINYYTEALKNLEE